MSRLPGQFAALARQVAGQVTDVTDCSWQRDTSAVWRLTGASGGCWYLKRHSSGTFHAREVAALRGWAATLGSGRVPELAAADPEILVMVVTAVPGEPVLRLRLSAREEQQVHRQAGRLLGRLHETQRLPGAGADVSRLTGWVDEHLDQAGGLLTPPQRALVRECAARLAWLGPRVPAVASHGDFQPRNWLWDSASGRLGIIDWERAEPAAVVRDLVRLEYGPWDGRRDLREEFFVGYGRSLTPEEDEMLFCYAVLDALSGLRWGLANDDDEVVSRAWRTFERSLDAPPARGRPACRAPALHEHPVSRTVAA
ncbi:MAG TPA: aminoglycoside phosphotransferase family protein, partial [Trebonia sp.]|nr:aminoglycoside phosphotransferase family protein [Trebonia sp.]